jgi:MFS transporter, PHS family, inorganic phosphate transporter
MLGQLVGGALGDSVGVNRALLSVMVLQVVASLGSALFCRENFWELSLYRFVLGIGAGGVYPLAAVLSSGQNKSMHKVVLTFAMQGLGFIAVPLVALLLLSTTTNLTLVWRILLGVGGVPGIVLLLLNCWHQHHAVAEPTIEEASHLVTEHDDEVRANSADSVTEATGLSSNEEEPCPRPPSTEKPGIWEAIRHEENLVQKMLGTAATWFLFDILFYGNTLFQPIVIAAAFGAKDHTDPIQLLVSTAQDTFLLSSIALPGYAAAGLLLGQKRSWCYCGIKQTTRFVMLQGFAAMAVLYLVIGVAWRDLERSPALLVLLYGLTFFFANYGPNTTTFVLPSLVYSPDCRSTLNGICAAAGKFGALVGASMFGPLASSIGDANIMLLCAGVSVIAGALARAFVPMEDDAGPSDNNEAYETAPVDESSTAVPIDNAEPA